MPSEAMQAGGSTEVWLQAKDNQRAIGDAFLAHVKVASPELFLQWGAPSAWMELAEEHACSQQVFAHLATFLVKTYVIPAKRVNQGKHLRGKSAECAWSGLLQQRKQQYIQSTRAATRVRASPTEPSAASAAPPSLRNPFRHFRLRTHHLSSLAQVALSRDYGRKLTRWSGRPVGLMVGRVRGSTPRGGTAMGPLGPAAVGAMSSSSRHHPPHSGEQPPCPRATLLALPSYPCIPPAGA